jgi:hypothetical protein
MSDGMHNEINFIGEDEPSEVDPAAICSACRWSMPLDHRYDQVRCCNDDSGEAWGEVEGTHTCPQFKI